MVLHVWWLIVVVGCHCASGSSDNYFDNDQRIHLRNLQCYDATAARTMCIRESAIGRCKFPSVHRLCKQSCNACGYDSWLPWGPWNECSASCSDGIMVRRRLCSRINCGTDSSEQLKGCHLPRCNVERISVARDISAMRRNLYDISNTVSKEVACFDHEFKCPDSGICIDSTMKCDGKIDCSSGADEENCTLGLRYDGVFGIINWKYHECAESTTIGNNAFPWMYRRCPGPYDNQKGDFMWTWIHRYNLRHIATDRCLSLNISYVNGSNTPDVDLILTYCNIYDLKQKWICTGYKVKLLYPNDVLPGGDMDNIYLRLADGAENVSRTLNLNHSNDESSDFYMLGTNKRLNICARRGYGGTIMVSSWSVCDRTCGGGMQKRRKPGSPACLNCDVYETRRCNTQPCPVVCPPEFTLHVSPYSKDDKNCFKVFGDTLTFSSAQKYCQSNNWTLAADKDIHTHALLISLVKKSHSPTAKHYIGIHENLGHNIRTSVVDQIGYIYDGQPLGTFRPFHEFGLDGKGLGCITGFGSAYKGSFSVTAAGNGCFRNPSGDSYCRNHDISLDTPWCFTATPSSSQAILHKQACDIPNCMKFDASDGRVISHEHSFAIQSLDGDRNLCIAVLESDQVVTTDCDCTDMRQNFQWLRWTYLINSASGKCLSVKSLPPEHGSGLAVETCPAGNSPVRQGWHAVDYHLSLMGTVDTQSYRYVHNAHRVVNPWFYDIDHSSASRTVFISDRRRELFKGWNEKFGITTLRQIISSSPLGHHFLLKGENCGKCIKSLINSRQLELAPCSAFDYSQSTHTGNIQWTVLKKGSTDVEITHTKSKFHLTCACTGYTPVCLTPDEQQATAWKMVINENVDSFKPMSAGMSSSLGYAFTLQSTSNILKCAYPIKLKNHPGEPFHLKMTNCTLHGKGQLWWLSEDGLRIKHKGLDKCIEACTTDRCLVTLQTCSSLKMKLQTWSIISDMNLKNNDDSSGDFICLKYNHSVCMSSQLWEENTEDEYLLTVKVFNKSRHWIALLTSGYRIPLEKMNDCVLPWMTMKDYRGSRSWTVNGKKCQLWRAQWPHRHPFLAKKYFSAGLAENFCRSPPSIPTDQLDKHFVDEPWCITLNPSVPWERCTISRCVVAGVTLHGDSGLWHSSGGGEKKPFICQAPSECFMGNGIDYSGYYSHTGKANCLNWREYNNGDKNWPDHARCMNWNNDTLKPWCWVAKGTAQYCDLITPCPARCGDPRPLMRNMYIVNISYPSPSKYYMPESNLTITCKQGYQSTERYQVWRCAKQGKWTPRPLPCTKVVCEKPKIHKNAVLLSQRNQFFVGSKVVYHCKSGYMISPGHIMIEVTCLADGRWTHYPYQCEAACKEGWVSFNYSCYKLNHDKDHYYNYSSALEKCSKHTHGSLAIPKNHMEYNFLSELATDKGYPGKPYWVGVRNDPNQKGTRKDKIFHDWIGDGTHMHVAERDMYLDTLQNLTFKIMNFVQFHEKKPYIEQCISVDNSTNDVIVDSCVYGEPKNMEWMWTANNHLHHLNSGLCLTAQGGDVYVDNCKFGKRQQMFVCGPENGYLLRLKHQRYSYVVLHKIYSMIEVRIGSQASYEDFASWLIYPERKYLCHRTIKPPDPLFIVHKGDFPQSNSFHRYDKDPCLSNITGSRIASVSETYKYMHNNVLDWCACLYAYGGFLVSFSPNSLRGCYVDGVVPQSINALYGFQMCTIQDFGDSLCKLDDNSHRSFLSEKCASFVVQSTLDVKFIIRECNVPQPGYICEKPAKWKCSAPVLPRNAEPLSDWSYTNMGYAYGSEITIHCKDDFWIESEQRTDIKIFCNKHLKWETRPQIELREDSEEKYLAVNQNSTVVNYEEIKCSKVKCDQSPFIYGMELVNETDKIYYVGDVVSMRCIRGTSFNSTKTLHNVTCLKDGSWRPLLGRDERCQSILCPVPVPIPFSNMSYDGLFYGSVVLHTCSDGYWFAKSNITVKSHCNEVGKWVPDYGKNNLTCVPVACDYPPELLSSNNIMEFDKTVIYLHGMVLKLRCKPGYWFDRNSFEATFTCNNKGRWLPFDPRTSKCWLVYCEQPQEVPGAVRFGSDYSSGSHVRYYCSRNFWIRRRLQIFNPQLNLCLRSRKLIDSLSYKEAVHGQVFMDNSCGTAATLSHWWQWKWTYHIRNVEANMCLTAAGIPILKEDSMPVRLEKCVKGNVFQMWTCASIHNEWTLRLLPAYKGAFLVAIADSKEFWADDVDIEIAVVGGLGHSGAVTIWTTYERKGEDMGVCIMKEGQFFEKSECNEHGIWEPNPSEIACTIVKCGVPPEVPNAGFYDSLYDGNKLTTADDASTRWDPVLTKMKEYDVTSKIYYMCNTGYWVSRNTFGFTTYCLDNGMWSPDPYDFECIPVTCNVPELSPWMKITFQKSGFSQYASGFRSLSAEASRTQFSYLISVTYKPKYGDLAALRCEDGYWIDSGFVDGKQQVHVSLEANCRADGTWSEPLLLHPKRCAHLQCPDPGQVMNGLRITKNSSSFQYQAIVVYQCSPGYWNSIAQISYPVQCTRDAVWSPDPKAFSCSPISCGVPSTVANAVKIGLNYSLTSEVTYKCNDGYKIGNLFEQSAIRCGTDGDWLPSIHSIVCEPVTCSFAPKIENAYLFSGTPISKSTYEYGDKVTMKCYYGFHHFNKIISNFTCNSKGEWEPDNLVDSNFKCSPAECERPIFPESITAFDYVNQHFVNDTVYYACPKGTKAKLYHTGSLNTIHCKFSTSHTNRQAFWNPNPKDITCSEVSRCPHLDLIQNSSLIIDGRYPGSIATYVCYPGYVFLGLDSPTLQTRCNRYSHWTPMTTFHRCVPKKCKKPPVDDVFAVQSSYAYGEKVVLTCPVGQWVTDARYPHKRGDLSAVLQCEQNGDWIGHMQQPICTKVYCTDPGSLRKGTVEVLSSSDTLVYYALSKVKISCQYGYVLSANGNVSTVLECSKTGVWTPMDFGTSALTCVEVACPDPGFRANSNRLSTGFVYGRQLSYQALQGYKSSVTGTTKVTISCTAHGTWAVSESSWMLSSESTQAQSTRYTPSNSSFLLKVLTFIPIVCKRPQVPPKNAVVSQSKNQLTIHCYKNFVISPGVIYATLNCTIRGWEPPPEEITCVPSDSVFCSVPPLGNIVVSGFSRHAGISLTVTCEWGYSLSSNTTHTNITCLKNGLWDPPWNSFNCRKSSCSYRTLGKHQQLTQAMYINLQYYYIICKRGYHFEDDFARERLHVRCTKGNKFLPDPSHFSCIPMNCGVPRVGRYGQAEFTLTTFQSFASYACSKGYAVSFNGSLYQSVTLRCNDEGIWSVHRQPQVGIDALSCSLIRCNGSLPSVRNTHSYMLNENFFNSKVLYRCKTGYQTASHTNSFEYICSKNGTWVPHQITADMAECVEIECPVIESKNGSSVVLYETNGKFGAFPVQNRYGDRMTYQCLFTSTSASIHTCLWFGQWEPAVNTLCIDPWCEPLPDLPNGFSYGSTVLGTQYVFQCKKGYEIRPNVYGITLFCCRSGESTVWDPPYDNFTCMASRCPPPTGIPQHFKIKDSNGVEVNQSVHNWDAVDLSIGSVLYVCPPVYAAKTRLEYNCTKQLTWLIIPKNDSQCWPPRCPPPPKVFQMTRINFNPSQLVYAYGERITYSCPRYSVEATLRTQNVQTYCQHSGAYVPDPTRWNCVVWKCPKIVTPPNSYQLIMAHRLPATMSIYRCIRGYKHLGYYSSIMFVCGHDRKWTPDPSSTACKMATCDTTGISHVVIKKGIHTAFTVLRVGCPNGFYLHPIGVPPRTICLGYFDPDLFSFDCRVIKCQRIVAPRNAIIQGNNTYGSTVKLRCVQDYSRAGGAVRASAFCQRDGTWSQDLQTLALSCARTGCLSHPAVANAMQYGNHTEFHSKIRFVCKKGFWFSDANEISHEIVQTCSSHSRWEPHKNPSCSRIQCPPLPAVKLSRLFGLEPLTGNIYTYVCEPMAWIAEIRNGMYKLTGRKIFQTKCEKDGIWRPVPNFHCVNLRDAKIDSSKQVAAASAQRNFKLSRNLPKLWVPFQPANMTLSDSTYSSSAAGALSSNINLAWDANPLTYWDPPKNSSVKTGNEIQIDIYFGKPIAVFGFMLTGMDDLRSDVANFTMIFADAELAIQEIGPFQVYGDGNISGRLVHDFPLKFSSVANCFVYDGLSNEAVWLHIIMRPLYEASWPKIREIGFFASDAKWEASEGADADAYAPLVLCVIVGLLITLLSPLCYLLDEKTRTTSLVYGCCGKKLPCHVLKFQTEPHENGNFQLLVQVIGTSGQSSIGWINEVTSADSTKQTNFALRLPGFADDVGEIKKSRVMVWRGPSSLNIQAPSHALVGVKNLKLSHTELEHSKYESADSTEVILRNLEPVESPLKVATVSQIEELYLRRSLLMLRSHLLWSIFQPPLSDSLLKVERFLCLMFMCVGGTVLALYIASISQEYQLILNDAATEAFIGAIALSPFPTLIRTLSTLFAMPSRSKKVCSKNFASDSLLRQRYLQPIIRTFFDATKIEHTALYYSKPLPEVPYESSCPPACIDPLSFYSKKLHESVSCPALDKISEVQENILPPVRISVSCPTLKSERVVYSLGPPSARGDERLRPSTSPFPQLGNVPGGQIMKMFSDVLQLKLVRVYSWKSLFHLGVSLSLIFAIIALTTCVVVFCRNLDGDVNASLLMLQSIGFTLLISVNLDMLVAILVFCENKQ